MTRKTGSIWRRRWHAVFGIHPSGACPRGVHGQLGQAFVELGVTRECEVMGTRYPVFESALSPYDPVTGSVVGQALDIAIAANQPDEPMNGNVARKAPRLSFCNGLVEVR